MFTYFEGYHPCIWNGLVKRGFIRNNTGLRFCENKMLDDSLKFNALAAKWTEFYRLTEETNFPMYIDRLQGGCYIDDYVYDEELLNDYKERLGDRYWGFQMHEWISNYLSDIDKTVTGGCREWTAEEIVRSVNVAFPGLPSEFCMLEALLAEEHEEFGKPTSSVDVERNMEKLYRRRIRDYGALIPCDSYCAAIKMELEVGGEFTRRFMPEVGAQTPDSRLQIVYASSMAKAYGAEFGVYYEPWGGSPFSACCYNRNPADNEWGIGNSDVFPFKTQGPNGGSSRSMQRRIHQYGYLSGASFMSEEWGMCNTFVDWNDFEVSDYGKVKLDFHAFTDRYPDPGVKLTPVAVVLPRDMRILENIQNDAFCLSFTPKTDREKRDFALRDELKKIFSNSVGMVGTETRSLINSEIPDAIDLIHSDSPTIGDYDYLVDLTGGEIPEAYKSRVISVDEAAERAESALPCSVSGGVHWMVNKCDGGYYLIIFNHSGVIRSVEKGEYTLPEADCTARIRLKTESSLVRLEGAEISVCENGEYVAEIPAGGWFFGKF